MRAHALVCFCLVTALATLGCSNDDDASASSGGGTGGMGGTETGGQGGDAMEPLDPDTAPEAMIDRFSDEAAMLFVRTADNAFPEAGEPIDFDMPPFITMGIGPGGEMVEYYNFDVRAETPAPIYALFRDGEQGPVAGQLNIVGVIPGVAGYNDFWRVRRVTVPSDYVANTVTSVADITASAFAVEDTDIIVNCPIVPDESTAVLRFDPEEDSGLTRGWYEGQVVHYFNFSEAALTTTAEGEVPVSPIYVTFNVNPDGSDPESGPPSGFVTEDGMPDGQTHNVVATLPGDAGYSPLWAVSIYDNADFASVSDLVSASDAMAIGPGPTVNCPIVSVEP